MKSRREPFLLSQTDLSRLITAAAILLRCFIITVVAMLFVWAVVFVARAPIAKLHQSIFGITAGEFNLFLYGFLTFIKCLNVVFFLFPWIAIKWFLHGAGNSDSLLSSG